MRNTKAVDFFMIIISRVQKGEGPVNVSHPRFHRVRIFLSCFWEDTPKNIPNS